MWHFESKGGQFASHFAMWHCLVRPLECSWQDCSGNEQSQWKLMFKLTISDMNVYHATTSCVCWWTDCTGLKWRHRFVVVQVNQHCFQRWLGRSCNMTQLNANCEIIQIIIATLLLHYGLQLQLLGCWTCEFWSWVQFPAMTLPGYFCDRWPYFTNKLSWDITTTLVNSALHLTGVAKYWCNMQHDSLTAD